MLSTNRWNASLGDVGPMSVLSHRRSHLRRRLARQQRLLPQLTNSARASQDWWKSPLRVSHRVSVATLFGNIS